MSDDICSYLPGLEYPTFVNTWLQHLNQLGVLHVVADVLENIAVGDDSKGSEYNPNWHILLDVRQARFDGTSTLFMMSMAYSMATQSSTH